MFEGGIEEHDTDIRMATNLAIQTQFVDTKPSQSFDALVSMVKKHSRWVFMAIVPPSQLERLTANLGIFVRQSFAQVLRIA